MDDLGTVNVTLLPPINCSLYREQFDGKIMICAGDRVRQKNITKDYLVDIVLTWASLYMDETGANFF